MKKINLIIIIVCINIFTLFQSCSDEVLNEIPLDFFSPENTFLSTAGFEAALVAMHDAAREEMGNSERRMNTCADEWTDAAAAITAVKSDWVNMNSSNSNPKFYWDWAYQQMIARANTIITRAENPEIKWATPNDKNLILAEVKFFRGYAYSVLANLFGGVPIIKEAITTPRYDFTRATKQEVLELVIEDLTFASQNLPETTTKDGRIVKAAADHYLSETYLSLGQYDNAIQAASDVINSGLYKIMTERFGDLTRPGDVFSDLFWTHQINRSSGNLETIWALQVEYGVTGGIPSDGGNKQLKYYGPAYYYIKDPDNKIGIALCDSLGRPNGYICPTDYARFDIWRSDWSNDMRNSKYNIRRDFYYNVGNYIGQKVEIIDSLDGFKYWKGSNIKIESIDTLRYMFPWFRKIEGIPSGGASSGNNYNEYIKVRLAETFLLRAEAYFMKGELQKAADDINVLRNRANATPVTPEEVDLDYILDERARELMIEERRLRTLFRMGKLVERVKKYNFREWDFIKNFHNVWPIPQSAIDANKDAVLEQNPDY